MEYNREEYSDEDKTSPWDYGSSGQDYSGDNITRGNQEDEDSSSDWLDGSATFEIAETLKRPGSTLLR
jgi:hypothetical protein